MDLLSVVEEACIEIVRVALVVAAIRFVVAGYVHLEVWRYAYRYTSIGGDFLADVVASGAVAVLLLARAVVPSRTRRLRGVPFVAVAVAIVSLAAFALSRGPGVPTLHGLFKERGLETTPSYFFGLGSSVTVLIAETCASASTSDSDSGRTAAQVRARRVWKRTPSCGPSSIKSRACNSTAHRHERSTTSSTRGRPYPSRSDRARAE
jgi:hypothetical protein